MEKTLHTFLKSGLIEKYVLGDTSPSEELEVEYFIERHDEARLEYENTQKNLEIWAKANAVEAPTSILDNILGEISEKTEKQTPVIHLKERNSHTPWYSIAASIVALVFAGSSYLLYQQNQSLNHENDVVVDEIFDLRSDIDKNNEKLDDVMKQFMKLNNPDTKKYVLKGNERAKNLKTVAYINPVEKTSMIDVATLPQLPNEKCYQIWAEVQDRMVNLGILDPSESNLQNIPYLEDALGLSITIEDKGGANTATADNSVAEISLQNK
ncbi:anti-sigma factor [Aegicerativicinus sediminis]|uniref:anti-sigma factor n=1 Tax=Aegicerativicinus sediminis TaxID=2893202 RepID=UPI001E58BF80|nr:anti-sigma factor [Aegicerativicinus sediminis]